jgi:ligand-binding sensor domain-containing protein
VNTIAFDLAGNAWFGHFGAVSMFDGSTWMNYSSAGGTPFFNITTIYVDANNVKWFGSDMNLFCLSGQQWKTVSEVDGLLDHKIAAITADANNALWFGSALGVSQYIPHYGVFLPLVRQ